MRETTNANSIPSTSAGFRPSGLPRFVQQQSQITPVAWQRPGAIADVARRADDEDILVCGLSGCSCPHGCYEGTAFSSRRHLVSVALNATRLRLTSGRRTLFEGIVPAGTLRVVGASRPATVECSAAGDLINFHVQSDYLRERQWAAHPDAFEQAPDLDGLVIRDPLVQLLSQSLRTDNTLEALYVKTLGTSLVMHIAGARFPKQTARALPKWRLKRVSEYIDQHLDKEIGLADLASAAGLSRMHFAAQFRVATGCSPHDFLLHQRVESAKKAMICSEMPLASVALDAGFQAQSHFSTVFKRFTGVTPARWRRAAVNEQRLGSPHRDRSRSSLTND